MSTADDPLEDPEAYFREHPEELEALLEDETIGPALQDLLELYEDDEEVSDS